jgi:superfamily II DNA or RNA helicase
MLREQRQKEFADKWMNSGRFGILLLAPRFGKIRTSIEIFKQLKPSSILIAYPDLKIEKSWKDDFEKFGYSHPDVTFTTHLSMKKYVDRKYGIVVIDEIHLLSDAQMDVLNDILVANNDKNILGLSGTMTGFTENTIYQRTGLGITARYSIEQAVEEGVIVDYQITVMTVSLDNTKLLDYKGKKRTEKKQFDALSWVIDQNEQRGQNTMFLRLNRMRIIQKSVAKLEATKRILEAHPNDRILVFCGVTEIADNLGCPSYHSKSSEKQMFMDFAEGKGNHMAVVKIGNTGVTYKPLNKVIINYFDSNGENMAQKILRCMAMEYDNLQKKAEIVIVSSNEPTELKWLKKALEFFQPEKVKYV